MAQSNCNGNQVAGGDLGGGGPFREMLVELSEAVFAALQNMADQEARKAKEPAYFESTVLSLLTEGNIGVPLLCKATSRNPRDCVLDFTVRLECGHVHRLWIEEHALHLCTDPIMNVIDQLDVEHECNPRSCYCTPGAQ